MEPTDADESEYQVINEEFKIWKKNCPFLYDIVVTHALEWPSLTCDWLPEPFVDEEKHTIVHNLVLGTHCGEGAQNALLLANVTLPLPSAGWDDVKVDANCTCWLHVFCLSLLQSPPPNFLNLFFYEGDSPCLLPHDVSKQNEENNRLTTH